VGHRDRARGRGRGELHGLLARKVVGERRPARIPSPAVGSGGGLWRR
jgi:hypothetical protein